MIKKSSKKTKRKPPAKASTDATVARLQKTIAAQAREIREGAEQQAATSDILRMIARAPADLQSVMDTIAASAARLCEAKDALIFRVDGDVQQRGGLWSNANNSYWNAGHYPWDSRGPSYHRSGDDSRT